MTTKKSKDKKPTPEVKDGAKKYIATILMLVGGMILFFVYVLFIIFRTATFHR